MSGFSATKSSKDKCTEQTGGRSHERIRRLAAAGSQTGILALQRAVGNQMVSQLLRSATEEMKVPLLNPARSLASPLCFPIQRRVGVAAPSSDLTAKELIGSYTSWWGNLKEEELAKDLLDRLPLESAFVGQVLDELGGTDRDDVSYYIVSQATNSQIASIGSTQAGNALLRRMVRALQSGPTFGDEREQLQRVMHLISEALPKDAEESVKGARREVEVITFRTGKLDWLGKVIGARGHTAIIVGGYAYSFEYDWRCGMTKEEYMKANQHRVGVGQVLDLTEEDARKVQKKLNESCSKGLYLLGGDVCTDATGKVLETVLSGLNPGWNPQDLEKQLDASGKVKSKTRYPRLGDFPLPDSDTSLG